MTNWHNKVVIITGGSAGLGRAMASAFGAAGARVVVAARNADRLQAAAEELESEGVDVLAVPADVTDDAQVHALVDRTLERFGRIDALINNAGRSTRGRVLETPPEEFRELFELNFLAAVRCTSAAASHLVETRGHLINIGSLAGKTTSPYLAAYPASKAPLVVYSQQLRMELGSRGVHVLLVCPGPISRADSGRRYDAESKGLPESAGQPGGGVKLRGIAPEKLARLVLRACHKRSAELVVPRGARLLFAVSQLFPRFGDWVVSRMTK